MREHHHRAISALVERMRADDAILAVIIGGSLAKGLEQEYSDVDGFLVVTDDEFRRRVSAGDISYVTAGADDLCDYPGGYVDFKTVDLAFLKDAAERGSEPARSAFIGAFVPWSRLPGLEEILARIPVYPEADHHEKVLGFLGQIIVWDWLVAEAAKRRDAYLAHAAAARLVLFAGRLVLARNRILYPSHKWLMTYVDRADSKPDNFAPLANALLRTPTPDACRALMAALEAWQGWEEPPANLVARFVQESEWNWRDHPPPLEDA